MSSNMYAEGYFGVNMEMAIREGYLHKRGTGNTNWKFRFCKLVKRGDTYGISYRKREEDLELGFVDLWRVKEVVYDFHDNTVFKFLTAKRIWYFQAESPGSKSAWLVDIHRCLKIIRAQYSLIREPSDLLKRTISIAFLHPLVEHSLLPRASKSISSQFRSRTIRLDQSPFSESQLGGADESGNQPRVEHSSDEEYEDESDNSDDESWPDPEGDAIIRKLQEPETKSQPLPSVVETQSTPPSSDPAPISVSVEPQLWLSSPTPAPAPLSVTHQPSSEPRENTTPPITPTTRVRSKAFVATPIQTQNQIPDDHERSSKHASPSPTAHPQKERKPVKSPKATDNKQQQHQKQEVTWDHLTSVSEQMQAKKWLLLKRIESMPSIAQRAVGPLFREAVEMMKTGAREAFEEFLARNPAVIHAKNEDGETLLFQATSENNADFVRALLQKGCKPDFFAWFASGDVSIIESLAEVSAKATQPNPETDPLLDLIIPSDFFDAPPSFEDTSNVVFENFLLGPVTSAQNGADWNLFVMSSNGNDSI